MIVSVGSMHGGAGATSWSLLLASAWPPEFEAECAVVEADTAGGVLGARYGFGVDPGAVSLTAALRRSEGSVPVDTHGRWLPNGIWVVPGPETAEQASALWEHSSEDIADRLAADARVWLVDLGRLLSTSTARTWASRSMFTVLVTRSDAEQLVAVPSRVAELRNMSGGRLGVLVVGRVEHPPEQLREFFGISEVWMVADHAGLPADVRALLEARPRARRVPAWREALDCSARLAALTRASADAAVRGGR